MSTIMSVRPARVAGIAGVIAAMLVGTSCPGDTGVAAERDIVNDWTLFNIADTNGDGLGDVIWFSPSANALAVWLMDGTRVIAAGPPIPGPPGDGWQPVTSVDFNGDRMSDVVWTNAARGMMAVWLLNGAQLLAAGPEIPGPPGGGWTVSGAGDTNGDGLADVAWENPADDLFSVWLMNGAQVLAKGPELPGPPHLDRLLSDLGDATGDGLADVFWTEPDVRAMQVYLMDGVHLLARGPEIPEPPGEGWTAVAVADFNHDNLFDVVWTSTVRGSMTVSLMNGAQLLAPGPEIPGPGEGWTLAYAGDVNGDGMADAAWQKGGTSLFTIWLMDGARVVAKGPVLPGPGEIAGTRP
jgi:hypothetical protein